MKKKRGQGAAPVPTRQKGPTRFEVRLRIVREVLRGATQLDVALAFGVSAAAVQKYVQLYRHGGVDALRPLLHGAAATAVARAGTRKVPATVRAQVVTTRQQHEDWGTRRIRDVMARFDGLGVSETTVRRILHEEGLL